MPLKRSEFGFMGVYMSLYILLWFYLYFYTGGHHPHLFGFWIPLILPVPILLMLAPVIPRWRRGPIIITRMHNWLAWAGATGIALLFYFLCTSLLLTGYSVAINTLSDILQQEFTYLLPGRGWDLLLSVTAATVICSYGYTEAWSHRVEQISFSTSLLPDNFERFRIVQISDLHLGMLTRKEHLRKIIETIRVSDPDLIVSTGDLLDGEIEEIEEISTMLLGIHPPYGKIAVTGNHEYYAGLDFSLDFTGRAGFTVLRGQAIEVGPILVAGIDDPGGKYFSEKPEVEEDILLKSLPASLFVLLLKHRPLTSQNTLGYFDLQLSGHVHKGQLFPFGLITRLAYSKSEGLSSLGKDSWLYVSRGTGTWGPPVRFLAKPEITVIDLENSNLVSD